MKPPVEPLQAKKEVFSSILICCDFLTTRKSEQASNLRWVRDLLERPIKAACCETAVRFELNEFDEHTVLAGASGPNQGNKARHRWFDPERIKPSGLAHLARAVGEKTLVIGYELSHSTRRALDQAGLHWIDIWLHPVRFSDDILFAIRASSPLVHSRLERFNVQEETFFAQADLLKIQNYRGFNKLDRSLDDESALFVGQTARDKSVLSDNGFLNLLDFEEEFKSLTHNHSSVYFSRHPNEPRLAPEIARFLKKFANVSEIGVPTYHLLAAPQITTVASISSSVLEEARFFGKKTIQFHPSSFELHGEHRYCSIFQDLCFAHFWADVLSEVVNVHSVPEAGFLVRQNKLRHPLSFYWGYRDIDRYEQLGRVTQEQVYASSAETTLNSAEIVSFDVFDTLITRRVSSPRDVFELCAACGASLANLDPDTFSDRRVRAERIAGQHAFRDGREEPTLTEIYQTLLNSEPDDPRVAALVKLEVSAEEKVIIPRLAGRTLFNAALAENKRIILVSDMYLSQDAVEYLLSLCGYDGWEKLYLSSELGLTKRTGSIFEALLAETGVEPARLFHIGDNPKGDKEVPARLGISCHPLPTAITTLEKTAPYLRKASTRIRSEGVGGGSAILSQVARQYFDSPTSALSDFLSGDAEAFGYIALGPLATGFASWLGKQADRDGVEHLAFLTREGPIFRAAVDALFPDARFSTTTLFASRRLVRSASFTTAEDVQSVDLSRVRHHQNLADFLHIEYGLETDKIDPATYRAVGFGDENSFVGANITHEQLRELVSSLTDQIIAESRAARTTLQTYLEDSGMLEGKAAVVDIGYAGHVQSAFSEILGTHLFGYYAATFRSASKVLKDLPHKAYLGSGFSPSDRRIGLCRHRKIYETLLCAPGQSVIAVEKSKAGWEKIAESGSETPIRDEFIVAAHKGALDFARDYAKDQVASGDISPTAATAFLDGMLDAPTRGLAVLLSDLEFDDPFDNRRLVSLVDKGSNPEYSVWPQGASKLLVSSPMRSPSIKTRWEWSGPYGLLGWRHLMTPIVAIVVARIGDVQDADHYRDDPIGFFRRLSDPRYRRIGIILYPRD